MFFVGCDLAMHVDKICYVLCQMMYYVVFYVVKMLNNVEYMTCHAIPCALLCH